MKRKEALAILLCIFLLMVPVYMRVFMRLDIFSLLDTKKISVAQDKQEPWEMAADATIFGEAVSETELMVKGTGIYYQMGDFVVNIAHTEAQRFLKVAVVLEVENKKVIKELESKTSSLRDTVIAILSSKDFPEIEGLDGKNNLRREIMDAINVKIDSGKVINIYFEEFVAQ